MNSHVFDGSFEEIYTVCSALPEISPWASITSHMTYSPLRNTYSKQATIITELRDIILKKTKTQRKQRAKRNFETTRTRKTLSTTNISTTITEKRYQGQHRLTTTTQVSGLKDSSELLTSELQTCAKASLFLTAEIKRHLPCTC